MADQLFSTSPYGKALFGSYGGRRPTIAILGDSYGHYLAAAIQYACARYYPADIAFDHRAQANGGRLFSVGGTASTHVVSTQIPQFEANPADVAFIWTGYNNTPNSLAAAQAVAADITSAATSCLAAGAKLVVLCGQTAKGAAATPWAILTLNTLVEAFARATPGVMYLDTTGVMADPASTSATAIAFRGGSAGTPGSYTFDGVHPSARAVREGLAPIVWPVLERIARRRLPRAAINSGQFDPVNRPHIDLLGNIGLMTGTSGQLNGVNNAGVAGETYGRWNVTTAGGVVVTPSIVTGPDGCKRQRLAFSGTMASGGYVLFDCNPTITNVNAGDAARLYDTEAVVELNGVTGLFDIVLVGAGVTTPSASGGTGNPAHQYADGANDGPLFYYGLYPQTIAGNNPLIRLAFYFQSGTGPTGHADISRVSCKRVA